MPTINATVKQAKQVWASPDGQKKIFKLVLDVDGGDMDASSYSEAVAKVGWTGELDTYEKEGKYGTETFVRQPKKEGFGSFGGGKSYSAKPQGDQYTMYLSYAKDIMVAMMNNGYKPEFDVAIQTIIGGAHVLYESRPSAEAPKTDVVNVAKEELESFFAGEPERKWN